MDSLNKARIIVVDGPEKAGKTTFINYLKEQNPEIRIRKQTGAANPNWLVYLAHLVEDIDSEDLVVWDRSWASEWVYRRAMDKMDLGGWMLEYTLGKIVHQRILLLGPGGDEQFSKRDETDMPIDPELERALFADYGHQYGWLMFKNQYSQDYLEFLRVLVINSINYTHGSVFRGMGNWETHDAVVTYNDDSFPVYEKLGLVSHANKVETISTDKVSNELFYIAERELERFSPLLLEDSITPVYALDKSSFKEADRLGLNAILIDNRQMTKEAMRFYDQTLRKCLESIGMETKTATYFENSRFDGIKRRAGRFFNSLLRPHTA